MDRVAEMMVASDRAVMPEAKSAPIWPHLYMVLYGIGWAVAVDLGVRIYAAEVFTLSGLLMLRWWGIFQDYPAVGKVLGVYFFWSVAIIVSDISNATPIFDSLRNLANPVIGGAGLIFVASAISRAPNSLITFFVATSLSKLILGEPLFGDRYSESQFGWEAVNQDSNYFKVRFEPFLSPMAIVISSVISARSLLASGVWLTCVATVYFVVDARSSGLVLLLTGMFCARRHFSGFGRSNRNIFLTIFIGLAGYIFYLGYVSYSISSESSGHNSSQLARVANVYNPFELVVAGRPEWLVIPAAIAERPILGWGSWARDGSHRFRDMRSYQVGPSSIVQAPDKSNNDYIPVHSVIGAAWVWSGLLGFISLSWLLILIIKLSLSPRHIRSSMLPVLYYLTFLTLWHYFFSPPQVVRMVFPISLVALIALPWLRSEREE